MKNEIKRMMKIRNMNQSELAKKLGISKENFSQQLSRNNFRINDLIKIGNILECDFIAYYKER